MGTINANEKIFNIRQLREHFDTPVLVGYYLGGGLERWLSDAGENAVPQLRNVAVNADGGDEFDVAIPRLSIGFVVGG